MISLNIMWYFFTFIGWVVYWLTRFNFLPNMFYYVIILVGLTFYILKLSLINDVSLTEFNIRTIIFGVGFYIYFLALGFGLWYTVYIILQHTPDFFHKHFESERSFSAFGLRMSLIAALMNTGRFISYGQMHRVFKSLRFTNKVWFSEVLFIIIALGWVAIDPLYTPLLISFISLSAVPIPIKKIFQNALHFFRELLWGKQQIKQTTKEEIVNYTETDLCQDTEAFDSKISILSTSLLLPFVMTIQVHTILIISALFGQWTSASLQTALLQPIKN